MGTHRPFLTQIEPRSTPARAMSEPDSPPPRTPVVAVVGTSDESTASFLSLLVRGDADVDRQMPAPGEVLGWTLDTKYYVADVACVFHALPGAYLGARRGGDAAARDASLAREMAAGAEALVLCYDPLDENAFAAAASFAADVAEAAGDGDRPEVRVLVGLYRDAAGVARRDPDLKRARDPAETWASSRGYEALAAGADADADAAVASASAAGGPPAPRDDGARRVREALEAHVWPGLTMKTKDVGDGSVGSVLDGSERAVLLATEASARVDHANDEETRDAKDEERSGGDGDSRRDGDSAAEDDLEAMIAEMARVRAAASGASDAARRKAAAEAATRMMRMFDLDGDAADSGTESDEDEEAR